MIPIKLAVRNFMPYRENVPPLYFTGMHTASICGENGSGKSALIDAITWALWGKTRAKSDDDIIHLGQNETEVEFDFAVGQQTYRVIRKHSRPRRQRASGQSSLDLFISNPSNGKDDFKPISGNSIRETEQLIIDTLHMDYDTFVNSAFLRQGHADEFTIASPAKRKQVLSDILGLSRYDELEEQAREMAKERERGKALAESAIEDIDKELAQKPACEAELARAQTELSQLDKELAAGESRLNELRQQKETLEGKRQQQSQLEKHLLETARSLASWNDQIKQRQARVKNYEEMIARRDSIETGYNQFKESKKASGELDQKLRLVTALNERKHKLEIAVMQASQSLLKEHTLAENKINELETTSQKFPRLKTELQQAQTALNQFVGEEELLKQKRQAEQQLRTLTQSLESDRGRLEKELAEIGEKLALLASQTGAVCPLCERELGEEHRKLIEAKYIVDQHEKYDTLKAKRSEFVLKQTELKTITAEIPRLETRLNQARTAAQTRISLLVREIAEADQAGEQLDEQKIRLSEIQEQLARKDFAPGEQAALAQLEGEIAKLGYDAQQHEQIRQRLASLEQWEAAWRKLDEADRLITQERESAAGAERAAHELRVSLEADNQKKQALTAELSLLPQLTAELAAAETEHRTLVARQKQAQESVGTIKGRLQRFAELEIKVKEKEESLAQNSKEEVVYRDLAQAFGKKGIQAWLIEMALPEIELEANKLLGRMTDNRMNVTIETQRQTKAGDTAETMDIKIADELGTRNYEMFSGGEAFRINFAIRIALSKLLARRAGAPLPTLIIDEGFGTQDVTGLEKLKEAIISIQDDFKMILVITHVEELRDAFPTRIDVIKTAEGSMVEVS
ncbi:MAG: SMC family ATPase [Chloroflexi bacterium]|nr:SMC family ATPase [Chloroflexota bacterium]